MTDEGSNQSQGVNGDQSQGDNDQSIEANAVRVKLPTFWSNNPITWFIQAEAQFSLGRITIDSSKYYHVVATLPQDVAESISDLLQNPPANNMYAKLKSTLIERHSLSIEARIKKLISGEEIGDKKPSEYFRTLQRLAGNSNTVGSDLLKKLWLGRLPSLISVALVPHKDEELSKVMKVADEIWEAMQSQNISVINQNQSSLQQRVASSVSNDELSNLRAEISELKRMVQRNNSNFGRSRDRFRGRDRSASRHRSHSRKRFNPKGSMCWYHFRFGSEATKCNKPCSFRESSSQPQSDKNSKN